MTTQERIISECTHNRKSCETSAGACCTDCWNASVAARRAERKAQLDTEPRCACCKRRGAYSCGGTDPVLLCGRHYNQALREARRACGNIFWASWSMSGADILNLISLKG